MNWREHGCSCSCATSSIDNAAQAVSYKLEDVHNDFGSSFSFTPLIRHSFFQLARLNLVRIWRCIRINRERGVLIVVLSG